MDTQQLEAIKYTIEKVGNGISYSEALEIIGLILQKHTERTGRPTNVVDK